VPTSFNSWNSINVLLLKIKCSFFPRFSHFFPAFRRFFPRFKIFGNFKSVASGRWCEAEGARLRHDGQWAAGENAGYVRLNWDTTGECVGAEPWVSEVVSIATSWSLHSLSPFLFFSLLSYFFHFWRKYTPISVAMSVYPSVHIITGRTYWRHVVVIP
jgi:hypothetical protein